MAKGLNKHTTDSDELFKRLEQNDSGGLDDFEKEALEGFESLENIELAKNLNASLHKKIDETYFQTQSGGNKKGFTYLSIAAGLVLVVGLSIFFMNIMGDKKEMAMETAPSSESVTNEVSKPVDIAPAAEEVKKENAGGGDLNTTATTGVLAEQPIEPEGVNDRRAKTESGKDDDGLSTRMIVKETKPVQSVSDYEAEKDLKKQTETKASTGPGAVNSAPASPVVIADQLAADKEEEASEKVTLSKNSTDDNLQSTKGVKKRETPRKQKNKSGESLGNEDAKSADESVVSQTAVGGVANAEPKRDEDNSHTVEFSNHAYYKPQDYIKVEINKSEMLKTNVKAFKAELTINEKGTVTAVKFLTTFDNCTGCKKELEKILLNMPGWKPKSKSAVETVSYIDQ